MRGRLTLSEVVGYCEPLPPFCPSPLQHISAAFGFHPGPETVGARSLDVAGLIRPFHGLNLLSGKLVKTTI
jgi:hypothetical protein